jgi:spore germination cell wall hydrolase CwlJ-like protein
MEKMHPPKYKALEDSASKCVVTDASVIRNRLAAGGYGRTATDVVHQPYQFTPWNSGSGNDPRRFEADSPAYKQAQALARLTRRA